MSCAQPWSRTRSHSGSVQRTITATNGAATTSSDLTSVEVTLQADASGDMTVVSASGTRVLNVSQKTLCHRPPNRTPDFLNESIAVTDTLSAAAGEGGSGATELQPCSLAGGVFSSTGAPVSSHAVCGPTAFGAGSGSATASIGNLGAEARGRHFGSGTGIFMGSSAAYSDTVVFSGPGDEPVPVRMNLHFAGTLSSTEGGWPPCGSGPRSMARSLERSS